MPLIRRRDQIFRDAEAAHMARLFGETPLGPVYFADTGEALPVSADERDLFLAQARRAIEAAAMRLRFAAFGVVVLAIGFFLAADFAQWLLKDLVPAVAACPPLVATAPAFLTPTIDALYYRHRITRLRRDLSRKLRFRGAVPEDIARPARRYNVFAIASLALTVLIVALWAFDSPGDPFGKRLFWPIALMVPVWLLHFAGRRVDAVHRRRPEALQRIGWKSPFDPTA
jgi:peptidoglycan/LPS O-acetylase OafA/YrhL